MSFWRKALPVITLLLTTQPAVADSLQGVLQDTRKPKSSTSAASSSSERSHRRRSHHSDCDDDNDFFAAVFGPPVTCVFTSPWWIPAAAVGDEYDHDADFLTYPYQFDKDGYLIIESATPPDFDNWGARFTTEYSTNFSDLQRVGGRFVLDTSTRFGFDGEYSTWFQDVGTGTDSLINGDANLVFRFAQSEQLQWYTGLGMNWLSSAKQGEVGFNFTYGVQYFPAKPFILETTIDWGTLGDAGLFHLHSSAGLNWKQFEIFTGYDYLRIGHQDLSGPLIGARLWF